MREFQLVSLDFIAYNLHYFFYRLVIVREKYHTGTIASAFGNCNALKKNEFVGNLYHNSGTVAGFIVCSFCTTMLQVFEHFQCVVDNSVRFFAVDVDNHTNTASIVLVSGIV